MNQNQQSSYLQFHSCVKKTNTPLPNKLKEYFWADEPSLTRILL